jgi:hypothetical protein
MTLHRVASTQSGRISSCRYPQRRQHVVNPLATRKFSHILAFTYQFLSVLNVHPRLGSAQKWQAAGSQVPKLQAFTAASSASNQLHCDAVLGIAL